MDRLLTPDELAARWAMKRWRVLAIARGNGIAHIRFGRDYRFRESDVEAYEDDHRTYTPDDDGEAKTTGQRRRDGVRGTRTPKAVGGVDRRGVDTGGPADPKGALRILRAGGESLAS